MSLSLYKTFTTYDPWQWKQSHQKETGITAPGQNCWGWHWQQLIPTPDTIKHYFKQTLISALFAFFWTFFSHVHCTCILNSCKLLSIFTFVVSFHHKLLYLKDSRLAVKRLEIVLFNVIIFILFMAFAGRPCNNVLLLPLFLSSSIDVLHFSNVMSFSVF